MILLKQVQFHENFQKLSVPFSEFELWLVSVALTAIDIVLSFLDAHTHIHAVTYSEAELKTDLQYRQYIPKKPQNSHPNKMPFNFTTSTNYQLVTCIFLLSPSLPTYGIQFFKFFKNFLSQMYVIIKHTVRLNHSSLLNIALFVISFPSLLPSILLSLFIFLVRLYSLIGV